MNSQELEGIFIIFNDFYVSGWAWMNFYELWWIITKQYELLWSNIYWYEIYEELWILLTFMKKYEVL
jgi:hypothetical protein